MKDLKTLTGGKFAKPFPPGTLVIDGVVDCASDETVPATTRVVFTERGALRFQGLSARVRFELAIGAGRTRIFENATQDAPAGPRVTFGTSSGQGPVLVDWWGARGDASADSAWTNVLAIQAALASLPRDPQDGKTRGGLRFLPGTYLIDAAIRLEGRIRVVGEGTGCPIDFEGSGKANADAVLGLAKASMTHVCIIDKGAPLIRSAFQVAGDASRVEFSRLVVCHQPSAYLPNVECAGVLVFDEAEVRLTDCGFLFLDHGIRAWKAHRVDVLRCGTIWNRVGICLERVTEATIQDCRFGVEVAGKQRSIGVEIGCPVTDGDGIVAMTRIRGCRFGRVVTNDGDRLGIHVVASRTVSVQDCAFEFLACGVSFASGSLVGMGAEVGPCRYEGCQTDVDPGAVSSLVQVHRRGGSATRAAMKDPPSDAGWRKGDVIRNATPALGQPFGWVCVGHDATTQRPKWMAFAQIGAEVVVGGAMPDRPEKIAGTHHYDWPVDKSPAVVAAQARAEANPLIQPRSTPR